jgi:hypothetical protein
LPDCELREKNVNTKKTILKLFGVLAILLAFAGLASAQTALTQTTLAAAVSGGPYGQINAGGVYQTTIFLASTTNILSQGQGGFGGPNQFQTAIYTGKELMYVVSVNTTANSVTVLRAQGGTPATGHPNADMVLYGSLQAFQNVDPFGNCTAASILYTPYINVSNGMQWLCSTVTGAWVPGWNNPGTSDKPVTSTVTVASAAGAVLPSGPLFQVTGSAAITGFTIPVGFDATAAGGGCFQIVSPIGATWTWTNAGNIALGGTGTAGKIFKFCWEPATAKFYPDKIS